ncbi:MAG: putative sulfate/molybdate transporter [Candidatus Lokiarchaeota archaeon]|nr:putative sulfate/molybdate transporter [Candidatus Lokiarchaeota archaeon]
MESNTDKSHKKFSLRELGGALGDWGTLIPFVIGYTAIVGLNPAGLFLCLGITNIVLGIKYNLPLPVQPQKTIGSVALANSWSPNLVISTGFFTGVIWTILGFSKKISVIVKKIPVQSIRGIQLGLALILGWTAILLFIDNIILGLVSLSIIILLIKSKQLPSALLLVILAVLIVFFSGTLPISEFKLTLPKISLYIPTLENIVLGMILAGLGQLILTLTNVMVATVVLIKDLFPEKEFDANSLALNMGIINIACPFIGGMPLCHGSGGLAAQYAFGARTGGSMILEGIMEIVLGLFFSEFLLAFFLSFPQAILGAMLLYTAFILAKVSFKDFNKRIFPITLISSILCFLFNITIGFIVGLTLYYIFKKKIEKENLELNGENIYKGFDLEKSQ